MISSTWLRTASSEMPSDSSALADDARDLRANLLDRDVERLEDAGRETLLLAKQPQQDVLGADVVVVQQAGFFLRKHDHPPGPVGEPFEQDMPPA